MSHIRPDIFGEIPARRKEGEVRDRPLVDHLYNRTNSRLKAKVEELRTTDRAIHRLSHKSSKTEKDVDALQVKWELRPQLVKDIDSLEEDKKSLITEQAEAAEREAKAKERQATRKAEAGRIKEKMKANEAANVASAPKINYFLGMPFAATIKPPKIRRTIIIMKPATSTKRKAEDELEHSSKRAKPVAETDPPACTPPKARMQRNASPTVAGRGSVPNPRKSSSAGKSSPPDKERLRKIDSKVSKPADRSQASRRSAKKRVNTSAVKKALVDKTKNNKSEKHSCNNREGDHSSDAPALDESPGAKSDSLHRRSSRLEKVNAKKRRASDDEQDDHSKKKQKVDTPSGPKGPKGLLNRSNACFSNTLVQLLAAALEDKNLDALLGELDEVAAFAKERSRNLASAIQKAAKAGEEEKVSAVAHLRRLLEDMRAPKSSKDSIASPRDFQHVIAYGSAEGDRNRMEMSGDTQQDPHEYYEMLFGLLLEDKSIADAAALKAQFDIETATRYTCPDCKYESEPNVIMNNHHTVNVPEFDDDGPASTTVQDLLDDSMTSEIDADGKCSQCEGTNLRSSTKITNQPECFVVHLNRTCFGEEASKVNTKVVFDGSLYLDGVKNEERYSLSTVIMHKDDTPQSGHYTTYRKWNDEWFLMNDASSVPKKEAKDATKGEGHAAMMLYKKDPIIRAPSRDSSRMSVTMSR